MNKPYNRPLLYLDFLGFSEKILSQTIEESINYYKQILSDFEIFTGNSKFKVNFDIVSDSAFLWIEGENLRTTTKQLFRIASSFSHNSLFMKRPIRGSIIFDDFIIGDKSLKINNRKITTHLILGKAIVSGYKWEQVQDWFGISVNPLYLKIFEQKLPGLLSKLTADKNIVYYDIPTKLGEIKSYAVCGYLKSHIIGSYVHRWRGKITTFDVPKYSTMIKELKDTVKDFSILNKLTNTEKFLNYIITNNLFIDNHKKPKS